MEEDPGGVYSSKEDCQKQQAVIDTALWLWFEVNAAVRNSGNSTVQIDVTRYIKRNVFPGLRQETLLG